MSEKHGFVIKKYGQLLQCILFIGCYMILNAAYFSIPFNLFSQLIYYHGVVMICADLINMITPLEQVVATQNHLISAKADLEIVRGCDGAGVLFLLISAIAVFPANFGRKLIGFGLGISLIYGINIMRICGLYFVISHHPEWLQLIHIYVAPTLMVVVGCIYFAWWAFGSINQIHEST